MQIHIKSPTGKSTSLTVEHDDTILICKTKLSQALGIPSAQMRFLFAGRVLEDGMTLANYNIQKEATLTLLINTDQLAHAMDGMSLSPGSISLIIKNTSANTQTPVTVSAQASVKELKLKLEQTERVPAVAQTLVYQGARLQDQELLTKYDVSAEALIFLVVDAQLAESTPLSTPSVATLRVQVKNTSGSLTPLTVDPNTDGLGLKRVIEAALGVSVETQMLIYNGTKIEDGTPLPHHNIPPDGLIYLVVKDPSMGNVPRPDPLSSHSSPASFSVPPPSSSSSFSVPPPSLSALPSASLYPVGGPAGSQSMSLTIAKTTGERIRVLAHPAWSILRVKEEVETQMGVSPESQTLIYVGKKLENTQLVGRCNFPPDATVVLAVASNAPTSASSYHPDEPSEPPPAYPDDVSDWSSPGAAPTAAPSLGPGSSSKAGLFVAQPSSTWAGGGGSGAPAGVSVNASSGGLPSGWREVTDPASGRQYFQNDNTRETSWTRPVDSSAGWQQTTTPEGRVYYQNNITHQTQWHAPPGFASQQAVQPNLAALPRSAGLPSAWTEERETTSGRIFYKDHLNKRTQWHKPTAPPTLIGSQSFMAPSLAGMRVNPSAASHTQQQVPMQGPYQSQGSGGLPQHLAMAAERWKRGINVTRSSTSLLHGYKKSCKLYFVDGTGPNQGRKFLMWPASGSTMHQLAVTKGVQLTLGLAAGAFKQAPFARGMARWCFTVANPWEKKSIDVIARNADDYNTMTAILRHYTQTATRID